ncbi:MAG: AmmeMemoRadiSam system radical SAM enzyme [bacterium]|nr:AmmeMemoRadiSam system radical SAM enzyme [bacterium]
MNKQNKITRRQFVTRTGQILAASTLTPLLSPLIPSAETVPLLSKKEAKYWKRLPEKRVECMLCPRACKVDDMERGYCGVRENQDGTYYTLVHSNPCSIHIDPVEKKPFFHYLPGARTLSLATAGCNVNCAFCQNWEISQARPEQTDNINLPPEEVVRQAVDNGCPIIAFTYTEPVVFIEYCYDIAKLGNQSNRKSVMVTNGYINPDPMKQLCTVLSAVKVDLKAFTERFYKEIVGGKLQPVLDTLKLLNQLKIWYEIVYLVVPTLNDNPSEITAVCAWIKSELGVDVPLHFTRFNPMYKLKNLPPTPIPTLERCRDIGRDVGLRYVYIGNVPGHEGENTYCPSCKKIVVQRIGFRVLQFNISGGKCRFCQTNIAGVWT